MKIKKDENENENMVGEVDVVELLLGRGESKASMFEKK